MVPDTPLLYVTDFASTQSVAGISPEGSVYTSDDGGLTWHRTGAIDTEVHAMAAITGDNGQWQIWITTEQDILVSKDGGRTFSRGRVSKTTGLLTPGSLWLIFSTPEQAGGSAHLSPVFRFSGERNMDYISTVLNVPVRCALLHVQHRVLPAHPTAAVPRMRMRQLTPEAVMTHD